MVCCHNSHFNWLLLFLFFLHQPKRPQHIQPHRSVNALNNVVIIITPELSVPSCPIFLAITKQLTVVADPSITRIAIISSFLNPRSAAIGKNHTKSNQLHKHSNKCRLHLRCCLLHLKGCTHRHQSHRRRCRTDT